MGSRQHLIRRILKMDPARTDFIELIRNCDKLSENSEATGWADTVVEEFWRFGQSPSLHSCGKTVASLSERQAGGAHMDVFPLGLCGVEGPLSYDLTGLVISQSRNNYDYALQRFLDIVNHRFISLYYRACVQNDTALSFDLDKKDLIRSVQRSLSGADACGEFSLSPFLAEHASSYALYGTYGSKGLELLLRSYLGFDIEVRERVFSSQLIPRELQCRLGKKSTALLGENTQIGTHFFSNTKKFVLTIGPVDFKQCEQLLPGTKKYRKILNLVNFYLRKPMDFDIEFILNKSSLDGINLNGGASLGRSCYFKHLDRKGHCRLIINASRLGIGCSERGE